MTADVQDRSVFKEVLRVYDDWSSQGLVYGVTLVLCLGIALVLDIKYHVAPGRVLMFILPLAAISLIALPAVFFMLRGSLFRSRRSSIADYVSELKPALRSVLAARYDGIARDHEAHTAARSAEMAKLVKRMEELTAELERMRAETAPSKKVFVVRPYSPLGRGRSGSRPFRFSRPDSEGFKRA